MLQIRYLRLKVLQGDNNNNDIPIHSALFAGFSGALGRELGGIKVTKVI